MRKFLFIFSICIISISIFISGCSNDSDSRSSDDSQDETVSVLEGSWASTYHENDNSEIEREIWTFEGDTITYVETRYENTGQPTTASDAFLALTSTYSFTIGSPVGDENATEINYTVESITATPLTQDFADTLNTMAMGGISDWVVNEPRSIAGLNCNGELYHNTGYTYYNIFKINGNELYFGDENTGDETSEDNRPTDLDSVVYSKL